MQLITENIVPIERRFLVAMLAMVSPIVRIVNVIMAYVIADRNFIVLHDSPDEQSLLRLAWRLRSKLILHEIQRNLVQCRKCFGEQFKRLGKVAHVIAYIFVIPDSLENDRAVRTSTFIA